MCPNLVILTTFCILQKKSGRTNGKRKGTRQKHRDNSQDTMDEAVETSKLSMGEIMSPPMFHGNTTVSLCSMLVVVYIK